MSLLLAATDGEGAVNTLAILLFVVAALILFGIYAARRSMPLLYIIVGVIVATVCVIVGIGRL